MAQFSTYVKASNQALLSLSTCECLCGVKVSQNPLISKMAQVIDCEPRRFSRIIATAISQSRGQVDDAKCSAVEGSFLSFLCLESGVSTAMPGSLCLDRYALAEVKLIAICRSPPQSYSDGQQSAIAMPMSMPTIGLKIPRDCPCVVGDESDPSTSPTDPKTRQSEATSDEARLWCNNTHGGRWIWYHVV